jgi:hypothetical protein
MEEGTPHYFYPPTSKILNSYERAIFAFGAVLARYDNDGLIATLGFGAKFGSKVAVNGVQGVLDAYRGVFKKSLKMSSSTDLTEVIRTASLYAQSEQVRIRIVAFVVVHVIRNSVC